MPELLLLLLAAAADDALPATQRALRGEYVRVLTAYADGGDEGAAVAALGTLEADYVGDGPSGVRSLKSRQLAEVRDLAEVDAAALVPVLHLHYRAYVDHFARGRFVLAAHSREMAIDLAELARRALPAGDERTLVADVLVSLAEETRRERMLFHSEALLRQAIEVDPDHVPARLLLATHYEWLGRFAAARDALRDLIAVDPAHREGRLRLAVNLGRCGEHEESLRLARQLMEEPVTDWVLALACQTLAGGLGREERFEEAVAVLQDGVSRLPGDQGLLVQRSYFLERAGRSAEAAAALSDLPLGESGLGTTPRRRYTGSPEAALAPLRGRLQEGVAARRPRLARALAELTREGGAEP